MRNDKNRVALAGASRNAARAFEIVTAPEFDHVPKQEKSACAMAALIHCDLCRLVIAFDECERDGVARLLWMADISSKLFEAKNWYGKVGPDLLRSIAARRSCGVASVEQKIKHLRTTHQVHRIQKYAPYRNKFGYHYDAQALEYLQLFETESAEDFFEILCSFIRFSAEWAQLTKSLVQQQ